MKILKIAKNIISKEWFWYLIVMPLTTGIAMIFLINLVQKIVERHYLEGIEQTKTTNQEIWEIAYFEGQQDGYQAYEDGQKEKILKNLAWHESGNGKHRKILDTNAKYSYGLYHFQVDTVVDMYKRYYKQAITKERALEIANDDQLATKLASDAIFKFNEKWHWKNSFAKMAIK